MKITRWFSESKYVADLFVIELLVAFRVRTLKIDFRSTDLFSKNIGGVVAVTLTFPSSARCIPKSHRHRPSYQLFSPEELNPVVSIPTQKKAAFTDAQCTAQVSSQWIRKWGSYVNSPIQPSKAIQVEGGNNTHIIQDKHSLARKCPVGSFPLNLAESGLNFAWPV